MRLLLSYHSIGYLGGSILSFLLVAYLLSLRGKTRQTHQLAAYFVTMFLLCGGFLLRTSVYEPFMAKPASYVIGLYTAFSNVALILFLYGFPRNRHKVESRIVVALVFLAGCAGYTFYVVSTWNQPVVYNFETQFFEFQEPKSARPMGLVLLGSFVWAVIVGIRKTVIEEKRFRDARSRRGLTGEQTKGRGFGFSYLRLRSRQARSMRGFALAILLHTMFSLSYVLYTAGLVTYGDFQYVLTAAVNVQLFLYSLLYLNYAPQPASFMVRLIGVLLVTVIVVISSVTRIGSDFNEQRITANLRARADLVRAILPSGDLAGLPPDVLYVIKRSPTVPFRILLDRTGRLSPEGLRGSEQLMHRMSGRLVAGRREPERQGFIFRALQPYETTTFYAAFAWGSRQEVWELGTSYDAYRSTVHQLAFRLSTVLMVTLLLLLTMFPLLLYGGLVSPLRRLLDAVSRVNRGDYAIRVRVQIEDEIGFLSRSFNGMVSSIQAAHASMRKYAAELEQRVKARTTELEQSLAQVNGLVGELQSERRKSNDLLLNILPVDVAHELLEKGAVQPRRYDSVTILFSDFVGFTAVASRLSPEQLVEKLDLLFHQFDLICLRYQVEKLKTIGDAFMCAGGLPLPNTSHPVDACLAALEMRAFVDQARELTTAIGGDQLFELRIGLHTGPVMAGVIGRSRFAYDVWGDAVNVASRLETASEAGRINISGDTYERVKRFFECEPRGDREIKNRGRVAMYFLQRIRPELCSDEDGRVPNDRFRELLSDMTRLL